MKITFAQAANPADQPVAIIVDADTLPGDLPPAIAASAKAARFTGKPGQIAEGFAGEGETLGHTVLAGAGKADADNRTANLEKAGGALAAKFMTSGAETIAVDFGRSGLSAHEAAAVLLGAVARSWRYDAHRTTLKDEQKVSLTTLIAANAPEGTQQAWEVESALAEGMALTKELVTEPANVIYPESFVERVSARLEGTGAEITVLDKAEMESLGMGALLGVSQGSAREPRLLAIRWNGGAEGDKPTVFVGKGVTFDTGGISLKQPAGMEDMKWDMGGAGAVAGAMCALAKRGAKANVIGVCGLVENMPDGKAMRPGDVVTTMSGQTVEVINTDAEGRLVLCDALTWAQKEYDPAAIVDLATLTGAMIISLGDEHGGLFSNDDDLAEKLLSAGRATGDKLWRFPLSPAYDRLLESHIADMKNVGPRGAGSITAAQYLQRFIDKDRAWAHLDIAGMVWADKPGSTWGKGATAFGVRAIDRYVRDNLES
jgi:leucyl aminopeptidase